MHRREGHPRYMGSFVDFQVGIPESTGDMKWIFICFDLLTHLALLLCIRFFLEQGHLFGGCRRPEGPPVVLNPSPTTTSIFSEQTFYFWNAWAIFSSKNSIFGSLPYRPRFAFRLNLQRPKSCRRHVGEVCFPSGSLSLEISVFVLFLVTIVTFSNRTFCAHSSTFWAPRDHSTGSTTRFLASWP